ncbi:MAG: murein hydrolase activator EnvC family protein [Xanthobacteraceae bacterium]
MALRAALLASTIIFTGPVAAQTNTPLRGSVDVDDLKQRDRELGAVRAEQRRAAETARKLEEEIDGLGEDRRKLNQSLIDAAARIRAVEEKIAETQLRLKPLDEQETALRASLESRRDVIAEVLAALQRIGHRPPPAVMVRAEDALESVRMAMMLGAVLPDMRVAADALVADLSSLARVRQDIATERETLTAALAAQSDDRQRVTALIAERQRRQGEVEKSLEAERQNAAQLARQADNLKDLIAKVEQGLDPATRAARTAANAPDESKVNLAALKDPGRLNPAVPFMSAKGTLKYPVNGIKMREFGAPDGIGGAERGISIATRPGAQVTAPCDGWAVYAAPYRSYGQLLILNVGGGYHVLLAGMERTTVEVGQFVLTGEPVAVMGSGAQVASTNVTGANVTGIGQPVLYIEFRKDGTPVDPAPWWVTTESEKVRG